MGFPNRIRDEDCDIEALEPSDFEDGDCSTDTHILGKQRIEHIHYASEICKLSNKRKVTQSGGHLRPVLIVKIVGKVVLTHFLPKNAESVRARSNLKEELDDSDKDCPQK